MGALRAGYYGYGGAAGAGAVAYEDKGGTGEGEGDWRAGKGVVLAGVQGRSRVLIGRFYVYRLLLEVARLQDPERGAVV